MEKKITIEKNGIKITLEGYSMQELNRILTEQQEPIREVNFNELLNKQKQEPVRVIPLTIQEDFRHLVDTEEQRKIFSYKPFYVGDPVTPVFKITSIL